MIYLTNEERVKILLIDKILACVDTEYLSKLSESEMIVAKLKGNEISTGPIQQLIDDNVTSNMKIISLEAKVIKLESDIRTLAQSLHNLSQALTNNYAGVNTGDFYALKSNYGIY